MTVYVGRRGEEGKVKNSEELGTKRRGSGRDHELQDHLFGTLTSLRLIHSSHVR